MSELRNNEVSKIITVLKNNDNLTLNINGKWGSGKTYVSDLVMSKLNGLQRMGFLALKVNISDYDYCADPLVPFIITILDYVNNSECESNGASGNNAKIFSAVAMLLNVLSWTSLLIDQSGFLKRILSTVEDFVIDEKTESKHGNDGNEDLISAQLSNVRVYQQALQELEKIINALADRYDKKKLIIFIDDFDRANPKFSYRVMNIVHQLKFITNLQFCTIMNRHQFESQLQHIYGKNSGNDEYYLTKYIDLEINIKTPVKDNPREFLQELEFDNDAESFLFLSEWLSFLTVRNVQKFAKFYLTRLNQIFKGHDFKILLAQNHNAAYYLLLLNIVIVRYDLELRSLYYDLLTISEIEVIKEKLQHFKGDISNPLNYDNYKGAKEIFSGLIDIVGEVFNFIIRKIDKKTIENIGIEQFLNKLYEEYFNPS
ncbi:P-loop NTPase fold protein [Aquella oligotrophica]|uniref:KAP NTPase domain-containing protein n=1 Tax=Aquella oligotrophica TaxID=2067065 RepID=A0A2I7N442_9NEIS|nr:P-loop NTPase fold protein [Aquella oligotrophica]AUR51213.1 hypothetical protein CUN60_02465 [Aquella oligotrophica]